MDMVKKEDWGLFPINKRIAEELIREPKKVISIVATPHGNELLDVGTRLVVSKEIISWLKQYVK